MNLQFKAWSKCVVPLIAVGSCFGCGGAGDENPPSLAPATAVAKFCSNLLKNDQAVLVTLQIGAEIEMTTATDHCVPLIQQPCQTFLAAPSVNIALLDGATKLGHGTVKVEPNQELVFLATLDDQSLPTVKTFVLSPQVSCASFDPIGGGMQANEPQAALLRPSTTSAVSASEPTDAWERDVGASSSFSSR